MSGLPPRPDDHSPRRARRLLDRLDPPPRGGRGGGGGMDSYVAGDSYVAADYDRERGRRPPPPDFDRRDRDRERAWSDRRGPPPRRSPEPFDRRPPPPHFDTAYSRGGGNRYRPEPPPPPPPPRWDDRRPPPSPRSRDRFRDRRSLSPPRRRQFSPRPRSRSRSRSRSPPSKRVRLGAHAIGGVSRSGSPSRRPFDRGSPARRSPLQPRSRVQSPAKDEEPEEGERLPTPPPPRRPPTPPPASPPNREAPLVKNEPAATPPPPPTRPAADVQPKPDVPMPLAPARAASPPRQPRAGGWGPSASGAAGAGRGRSPPRGPRGDRDRPFPGRGRGGRRGLPPQGAVFSGAGPVGQPGNSHSTYPPTPSTPTVEPQAQPATPVLPEKSVSVSAKEKEPPAEVLPKMPPIPAWNMRDAERNELHSSLSASRAHRASLRTQFTTLEKGTRRALQELEVVTIDLRAVEERQRIASAQYEMARVGKLGVDYTPPVVDSPMS